MNIVESRDAKISYVNTWIVFLLALPLNPLLIWLIRRRSPDVLKQYSRILMLVCINDLVTVTMMFIVHLVIHFVRLLKIYYEINSLFKYSKYFFYKFYLQIYF